MSYLTTWTQLRTDCRAVTALEYGMIAGAVSMVLIAAMAHFSPALTALFAPVIAALSV